MRILATTIILAFLCVAGGVTAAPDNIWSRGLSAHSIGTSPSRFSIATVATNGAGDVAVAGAFRGVVDLDGDDALVSDAISTTYVVFLDASGVVKWGRMFPGTGINHALVRSISMRANGEVVIVGEMTGTIDFGGGNLTAPAQRAFVAVFDRQGNHIWSQRYGSGFGCYADGVAFGPSGEIVFSGAFMGTANFGGLPLISGSAYDGFVVALDPSKRHTWSKRISGNGSESGEMVAVDGAGNVYVAGRFREFVSVDPITTRDDLTNIGGEVYFLAQWGALGNLINSGMVRSEQRVTLTSLSCGGAGLLLAGVFTGLVTVSGQVVIGEPTEPGGFAALIDGELVSRWSVYAQGAESIVGYAVDHERSVIAGSFTGALHVGDNHLGGTNVSGAFVGELDGTGAASWLHGFSGIGSCDAAGVGADASGNVLMVGEFSNGIELGREWLEGAGAYLTKLGSEALPDPDVGVSLFRRRSSIEARWTMVGPYTFTAVQLLRTDDPATPPIEVFRGTGDTDRFVDRDVIPGQKYYYQVVVTTTVGRTYRSGFAVQTAPVETPVFENALSQNVPNPFNPATTIEYSLQKSTDVVFEIYDVSGATVRLLREGFREAGPHTIEWDGIDDYGNSVGSGVYFYRLVGVAGVAPKKMVLIK